ncbi:glycosyltransferase family 2 protein [Helicobacter himalayensis]|uniref:glycosyltransferase family 2 protein n=1 Tax=Helicobacter himalayensis TaxID=1591088 RepID=UPI003D6EA41E
MLQISACILVKNAQETLRECLESLRVFDEIILLDNKSTDGTLEIARAFNERYGNLRVFESEFIGFGALKNLCASFARNEWICIVDSDEVMESGALAELERIFGAQNTPKETILAFSRKNLYNGEWIKACGWYPDFVWRVYNKTYTHFNENLVHESLIIPKDARKIKLSQASLKHYAYKDIAHLLDKMQHYTSLYVKQNPHKKSSIFKALTHSMWSFVKNYFFKKGFLFGYKGFVISTCNALGAFFKYMKLYESHNARAQSCSLIITTYNQKERLSLVLDSVLGLQTLPNEVLIADDGSKEDTKELIESYKRIFPCELRHIWQEDKGFRLSKIRNHALCEARGEYIIIIDGDMVLESHFIDDHLHFARKGVFVQGSRVILDSVITQEIMQTSKQDSKNFAGLGVDSYKKAFSARSFKSRRIAFLARFLFAFSSKNARYFKRKDFIKGIRGCNMGFFKSDCVAINGFNEDFVGWGREDSEFVARFLFNGGELRQLKFSAIAYHLYHKENTREMLEANHNIYLDTITKARRFCKNGLYKKP